MIPSAFVLLCAVTLGSIITTIAVLFIPNELWFVSFMIGVVSSFGFYLWLKDDTIEPRKQKESKN